MSAVKKVGRASGYNEEFAALVCEEISGGASLRSICRRENMPSQNSVFSWLRRFPEFASQYTRACQARADAMAEEIIDIADDGSNDTYANEDGDVQINTDVIQRSKLRVEIRKWIMARMSQEVWGRARTSRPRWRRNQSRD